MATPINKCVSCKFDEQTQCKLQMVGWPYRQHCNAHVLKEIATVTQTCGEFEEFHPLHKEKSMRYALLP